MRANTNFFQINFAVFCRLMLLAALTNIPSHAAGRDESVSLINLIATPDRYHGKVVVVSAYVSIGLGNMSLCQVEHPLTTKDCLWLEIYPGPFESTQDMERYTAEEKKWKVFHGRAVSLRGTFDMKETGRK